MDCRLSVEFLHTLLFIRACVIYHTARFNWTTLVSVLLCAHTQEHIKSGVWLLSELLLAAFYANPGHFSINLAVRSEALNIDLAFHEVIYPEFI